MAIEEEYIQDFANYLKLEKGSSKHTIDNYTRDVRKLLQYMAIELPDKSFKHLSKKNIQSFLKFLHDLGLNEHSQARILSGLRGFYKFLNLENIISENPVELIEAPKLSRKLPDRSR